jgi:hypothetical protein
MLPTVLLTVSMLLSTISLAKAPSSKPTPIYFEVASDVLKGATIRSRFLPVGYIAFLVTWMKLAGLRGIFVGQAVLYVATIILAYLILQMSQVDRKLILVICIVIAFHPMV